jgi:ribonuclease-3
MASSRPGTGLGHDFGHPELLRQALTHRSFGADHNERLEFIGDSVLNCVVALALYERFPQLAEGELSQLRAKLVRQETLQRIARGLDLGPALRLGDGERQSGGTERPSILADALEAVIGAVFIDAGFDAAKKAILAVFADELAAIDPVASAKDPKTRLQELLQAKRLPVPEYTIVEVQGKAHLQSFEVRCTIPALGITASGSGSSRRAAEQEAAAHAYEQVSAGR